MTKETLFLLLIIICLNDEIIADRTRCDKHVVHNANRKGILIKSEGFPVSFYKSNSDDCWVITNLDGGKIVLEFRDMITEACCDKVTLYDTYDNVELEATQLSSDRTFSTIFKSKWDGVVVEFQTDSSINQRGWQACICPIDNDDCSCVWDIATNIPLVDISQEEDDHKPRVPVGPSPIGLSIGILAGVVMLTIGIIACTVVCLKARRSGRNSGSGDRTPAAQYHATGTRMQPVVPIIPSMYTLQQDASARQTQFSIQSNVPQPNFQAASSGVPQCQPLFSRQEFPEQHSETEVMDPPPYLEALAFPRTDTV